MNNLDFSHVSYEQVKTIADELHTSATTMESLLIEIKTLFDKIGADGVWTGTAASNAKESFDLLSSKFPEFSEAINDCCTFLNRAMERYQGIDQKITLE